MADGWDKIKNKIESGAGSARPADWEAMNAKIQAYPALSGTTAGASKILWVAISVLLVGLSAWWYFTDFSIEQNSPNSATHNTQEVEPINGAEENQPLKLNKTETTPSDTKNTNSAVGEQDVEASFSSGNERQQAIVPVLEDSEPITAASSNPASKEAPGASALEVDDENQISEKQQPTLDKGLEDLANESQILPAEDSKPFTEVGEAEITENIQKPSQVKPNEGAALDSIPGATAEKAEDILKPKASALAENSENPAKASSAAAEEFFDASSGFELSSVQLGGKYLHDFNQTQGWQLGGDVTLKNNNWLLNTGLYYGQNEELREVTTYREQLQIDSSFTQQISTRNVQEIRSYWVIDSFFAGHWANDTVIITQIDTTQILKVDTIRFNLREMNEYTVQTSYVELPIMAGYELPMNNFKLQVMGGVLLNQVITVGAEIGSEQKFGLSAIMQPALHYSLSPHYSAYLRSGLRYNLRPNAALRPNSFNYDIQLGIAIEW